ncbi:MAG: IS256 family transposase, partial [Pseudomonadota bacterium]
FGAALGPMALAPHLWIDATYVKARDGGRIVSRAVIVAVGVNTDGRREALGVAAELSEAEPFWTDFLRSLADRGPRGVKLVVADDHKGLRAASSRVFGAAQQRCRVHWTQGALSRAPAKQRPAVAALLKTVFVETGKSAALEPWEAVSERLRQKHGRIAELMDVARDDVPASMDFPQPHSAQIHSTNPLERLTREIKRPSDVVGVFPNDDAIIRPVGALMLEQNDEWTASALQGISSTIAGPALAVVHPAWFCGEAAAGHDGFRGSAA